jgi:hypothetical protein
MPTIAEIKKGLVRLYPPRKKDKSFKVTHSIGHKCNDCGQNAKFKIHEENYTHPEFRIWYYCGICEVGG